MRNILSNPVEPGGPDLLTQTKRPAIAASATRRSLSDLLRPVEQLAAASPNLMVDHGLKFEVKGEHYEIPRYLFVGPKDGGTPIRVGIFAAIHGDEPEGAYALVRLIQSLDANPELATGYCLSIFPVCNPTGFEDQTRASRNGRDLNLEFWRNSAGREVELLESAISSSAFDGIVSLHTHDAGDGFYGRVRGGTTLTRHLIGPALRAAETFLPRDERTLIDGLPARNGIVRDGVEGVLSAPPKIRPRPFELTLETPKSAPSYLKEYAIVIALQTILTEYRQLMAYAPNL
jgi:hypothetical protein